MKKVALSLLTATLVFGTPLVGHAAEPKAEDPGVYYPGTNTKIKPGDILVTNDTSSWGLTGHAAIVIDTQNLVEIRGDGYNPEKNDIDDFIDDHTSGSSWVKVYRHDLSSKGKGAAKWAEWYVKNYSDVEYGFSDLLDYDDTTYCSKIVWDAYYFGADVELETDVVTIPVAGLPDITLEVAKPYDLGNGPDVDLVEKID
ncbi:MULTISPECIES: YiiX/YebB-like N1pC/P60 family cysteine hydrolase [unclassified Brevibacillus]|uniref:YiiX/YebB-like N1pC/P60 family cysteine hydrolase n=1 Tax=Brevibacillus TaxID=55080 RepID=UPI000ED383EC|nr:MULTISPECIES: YiiX/YebB-like N1pC/P60 family cysteine hydrolase [unclassified Brevibacillus]UED69710.1 hypothetical protein HP435_03420 [Brevibacillus sp. HD3.3A]HBZ83894.1 hypothetical protein [Brevibacillus sp.]